MVTHTKTVVFGMSIRASTGDTTCNSGIAPILHHTFKRCHPPTRLHSIQFQANDVSHRISCRKPAIVASANCKRSCFKSFILSIGVPHHNLLTSTIHLSRLCAQSRSSPTLATAIVFCIYSYVEVPGCRF